MTKFNDLAVALVIKAYQSWREQDLPDEIVAKAMISMGFTLLEKLEGPDEIAERLEGLAATFRENAGSPQLS